jgi:hypothetical protein
MLSRWAISLGWEIIPYMRSKCFIQRCKTVILWNGSASHFQHSFWDVIQEVTYHCIWTIISVGVILCDNKEYYWKEGCHAYTLKSPNKQLMHTFLHFVLSLQSRFYTLALHGLCLWYEHLLLVPVKIFQFQDMLNESERNQDATNGLYIDGMLVPAEIGQIFPNGPRKNHASYNNNKSAYRYETVLIYTREFIYTLVKFSKISPTRAGSYCQRTSYRKWPVIWKMQKFQFFTASPLKMRACGTGRKFAESNQRVKLVFRYQYRCLHFRSHFGTGSVKLSRHYKIQNRLIVTENVRYTKRRLS